MNSPTPLIKEGMLIRITTPNFSWLMTGERLSPADRTMCNEMVQIKKGSTLTIVGTPLVEGTFCKYPVLYSGRFLFLLEPKIDFHVNEGFVKILKGDQ